MTGIERLYKLVADIDASADPKLWDILRCGTEGGWDCEERDCKTLGSALAAIADQIEREQGEHVSRMRVLAVVTEMERHVSGVEGAEDSPVARWARELREALGGDGRDPAADVSVSAYDLLPQEDREAIAWVREHGGLDAVKRRWECLSYYADPVPRSCMEKRLARLKRQIDESHAALRRRNQRIEELGKTIEFFQLNNSNFRHLLADVAERLGFTRYGDDYEPEDLLDALDRRLMPNGCEWPRYESGELVVFGATVPKYVGGTIKVRSIEFREGVTYLREGFRTDGIVIVRPGERVKRPAVPAGDGEPLEVGQTVYATRYGYVKCTVLAIEWDVDGYLVEVENEGGHKFRQTPDEFIHTKPEPPESWERIEEDARKGSCDYFGYDANGCDGCPAYGWNVANGGNGCGNAKMVDIVRRCRALAERERSER